MTPIIFFDPSPSFSQMNFPAFCGFRDSGAVQMAQGLDVDIATANASESKDKTLILNSIRLPKAQTKAHSHSHSIAIAMAHNPQHAVRFAHREELTDLTATAQDDNYAAVMLGESIGSCWINMFSCFPL